MSKLREADFYYGAVLSTLINNGICPMLIEGGDDRQVYDFTTDKKDFRLFVKYRSAPNNTKTAGYNSWKFELSDNELCEIKQYLQSGKEFCLGLVCGYEELIKSQYAVLYKENVEALLEQGKRKFTISRKTGEHNFRIPMGGGRENSLKVKTNNIF